MRATIKSDPGRGPGYGIIEIHEASAVDRPTFLLRRASDGKLLSASGWQESESPLYPDAWDNDSSVLRLAVGPAIVDELDHLDAYRISLQGQGQCMLAMENLLYSNMSGGQGMGAMAPSAVTPPQPDPVPAPAPEPEPEPVAAPVAAPPQPVAEPPASTTGKRSPLLMILLLIVLVAAAGAAVWWFVLRGPAPSPLPPVGNSAPAQQPLPPNDEAQPPKPSATPAPQQKQPPLRMAREHLRGQADPDLSLALARPLRNNNAGSEESDAAFLLLEDASQKGNAEAMLLVGQYYDPTNSLPKGSIPSDMAQARYWYEQARQKGQPQAAAALHALRAHVHTEAEKGNAEARLLLRQWPQGE